MTLRPYTPADRVACLEILESNSPPFFTPSDREAFEAFLDDLPGPYDVAEREGAVVACGGWALDSEEVAALTWGMVRRDLHGRGLGLILLRHRLHAIDAGSGAAVVRLRTIPRTQGFFEREGFRVVEVVPEGYGPGTDRVTMDRPVREA